MRGDSSGAGMDGSRLHRFSSSEPHSGVNPRWSYNRTLKPDCELLGVGRDLLVDATEAVGVFRTRAPDVDGT